MLRPKKPVITIVKLPQRMKNKWNSTKSKRIPQVLFQAKIDTSNRSTTARSESREIQTQQLMPVRVSRWWQELTHPCKYLKNNNWRTSRSSLTYLIDNSNNHQGLATQRQSQSHLWSTIDTSSWSAIHTSQLRQPGDYLKYNRTRAPQPRVHTFTAETNQKVGNSSSKERTVLNRRREQSRQQTVQNSTQPKTVEHKPRERTDIQANHSKNSK